MADRLFYGQFTFLQLSLILKLASMMVLLFYVLDYLDKHDRNAFMAVKFCYNMSWAFLYVSYNCVLYQWVFSIHRVNLYGDVISVSDFKWRSNLSLLFYSSAVSVIFLINNVIIVVEAFFPLGSSSVVVQAYALSNFLSLFICFAVIGSILIKSIYDHFEKNYT